MAASMCIYCGVLEASVDRDTMCNHLCDFSFAVVLKIVRLCGQSS